ncbi:MAG: DUF4190 domain-containing protein [candidate division WOR-3 bacterium]|nr:MAG: DUF4190 domain-containing protein [candidate division WOR-3 bacterium]
MEETTPTPPEPQSPAPQPTAPKPAAKTDGKAIASLILGIFSFAPMVGWICAIIAIILGAMSIKKINASAGALTGKPMAIIGLILGILGLVLGLIWTIVMIVGMAAAAVEEVGAAAFVVSSLV